MPFTSEKQRRFMHARHPEIAKKWEKEEKGMANTGYYRKSQEATNKRTTDIKERYAASQTPEGKRATATRLADKQKAARAKMTPRQRHLADRREQEAFAAKKEAEARQAAAAKPPQPVKPKTPAEKHSAVARERQQRWSLFPELLEKMKGKKKGK